MARLLIGVTGGIAAYKALETVRLLIGAGHAVRVIQTPNSTRFIGADSFAALTGAPVLTSEFEPDPLYGAWPGDPAAERAPISHLALVGAADLYLIAPASAHTIAKLAHGLADNLVCTAALAAGCPVIVAPAMNDRMYRHPATQDNVATLRARGVGLVGPGTGELASHGEHGIGRMSEPAELVRACARALAPAQRTWDGLRVLITAGGTREPIDSVRYIGNRSSGRMGYALARRAADRGAAVTLVAANVGLIAPPGVTLIEVGTAAELASACAERFPQTDVLLMAAAVADFRPGAPAGHKLKKDDGPPRLELELTADVLSGLAARRRAGQLLVGFAAETGAGAVDRGRGKLLRKRLDAVVVNDVSDPAIGFDAADNEVTIVTAEGSERRLPRAAKETIADGILDVVETLLSQPGGEDRGERPAPYSATGV